MLTTIGFILFGYFTGSLLFARYFSNLFCGKDVTVDTPDSNPGTYNAYTYGGFWCGALTLVCDLLKGFLPVFLYIRVSGGTPLGLVLVMSAPALGRSRACLAEQTERACCCWGRGTKCKSGETGGTEWNHTTSRTRNLSRTFWTF